MVEEVVAKPFKRTLNSSDVARDIVDILVSSVFAKGNGEEEPPENIIAKPSSNRRGAEKRRNYSASYKLEIIRELETGEETEYTLEEKYRINRSLVNK